MREGKEHFWYTLLASVPETYDQRHIDILIRRLNSKGVHVTLKTIDKNLTGMERSYVVATDAWTRMDNIERIAAIMKKEGLKPFLHTLVKKGSYRPL
jgi:hypothetical protein